MVMEKDNKNKIIEERAMKRKRKEDGEESQTIEVKKHGAACLWLCRKTRLVSAFITRLDVRREHSSEPAKNHQIFPLENGGVRAGDNISGLCDKDWSRDIGSWRDNRKVMDKKKTNKGIYTQPHPKVFLMLQYFKQNDTCTIYQCNQIENSEI